jgi:transposase
MTTEDIVAEISTLMSRLQRLVAELAINAKKAEALAPSFGKAAIDQLTEHAEEMAKLTKRHSEEMARVTEENADLKRRLGDLGQTL